VPHGVTCEAWSLLDVGAREAPDASVDDLVGDVVERLAVLPAPVVLVGHSFGAWVAAHAAARVPERVARCVLIAGSVATPPEAAREFRALADGLDAGQLPPSALAQVAASRWLSPAGTDNRYRLLIDELFATEPSTRLARGLRRLADAIAPVPPLSVPTLVLAGELDGALPHTASASLAAHLGCPFELWAGAGHFLHWSDPARLAALLAAR
jgi:pimeloyl-ACP methyl ester carboxylesterase